MLLKLLRSRFVVKMLGLPLANRKPTQLKRLGKSLRLPYDSWKDIILLMYARKEVHRAIRETFLT